MTRTNGNARLIRSHPFSSKLTEEQSFPRLPIWEDWLKVESCFPVASRLLQQVFSSVYEEL